MAELRALLASYKRQGGSLDGVSGPLDLLSGPQSTCCLKGWSTRSTPECLEGEKEIRAMMND